MHPLRVHPFPAMLPSHSRVSRMPFQLTAGNSYETLKLLLQVLSLNRFLVGAGLGWN